MIEAFYSSTLITFAGHPAITEYAGKLCVTTELAPTIHPSPNVTLGIIDTFCPNQHRAPTITGPFE